MAKLKTLAIAAATGLLLSATAATAAITTFAQFSNNSNGRNVRWQNNGTGGTAVNGTGGRFYTTETPTSNGPGNAAVQFKYEGTLGILGFLPANFFMDIIVASGNPATVDIGGSLTQPLWVGGFSFLSTAPITIGSVTYAIGTNLLTGTFDHAAINGSGSSGFYGNTTMGTLTYSSAFLDFSGTDDRDFAMGLTAITPVLFQSLVGGPKALRTFRAFANGSFSSNPAPVTVPIPEPEVWGMMVVGFGLVGLQVRRRKRPANVVA